MTESLADEDITLLVGMVSQQFHRAGLSPLAAGQIALALVTEAIERKIRLIYFHDEVVWQISQLEKLMESVEMVLETSRRRLRLLTYASGVSVLAAITGIAAVVLSIIG